MKNIVILWLALGLMLAGCGQATQPQSESTSSAEGSVHLSDDEELREKTEESNHESIDGNIDASINQKLDQSDIDNIDNIKEHNIVGDLNSNNYEGKPTITEPAEYDYVLEFPSDSYPETALHIYSAIENGHSDVCTIDRDGADERRKQSLKGIQTKESYDRDEWPMAMCAEGGEGASVAFVDSSDNRGAGSWVGHQLSAYEDGEKVLFIVSKPKSLFGKSNPVHEDTSHENIEQNDTDLKLDEELNIVYKNCTEAHEAGVTPLFEGEPGYSKKLDRDGDGVACEL